MRLRPAAKVTLLLFAATTLISAFPVAKRASAWWAWVPRNASPVLQNDNLLPSFAPVILTRPGRARPSADHGRSLSRRKNAGYTMRPPLAQALLCT